ncbi:hypothetical protein Q3G72_019314 [Acer saccharum]|nr:hypothetical protein Q3G72_019314 [Acer saccharum]
MQGPDSALEIDDEEDEGAKDDAPFADSSEVLSGPLASFHDSGIIADSTCTVDTLTPLRKEYQIPDAITLSLPYRGYDVCTPPPNLLLIHVAAFECEVRLHLHPTLCRAFHSLELTPLQISPRFWKHLIGFLVLWKEQCKMDKMEREPGFDEIRYVFQIMNLTLGPKGLFYLRVNNRIKFSVPRANVKFTHPWRDEWIVVGGD